MTNSIHYVARVVVEKVENTSQGSAKDKNREVSEVGNFMIKSEDLNSLVTRLQAHLELMEDDL